MKKTLIILIIMSLPMIMAAQSLDCGDFFKFRRVSLPYSYNSLSKSAVCITGNKYEFILPLTKGKEYRLSFYASPVFNNKIDFKIIDQASGNVVMNLPGETLDGAKGSCVLVDYFDEKAQKNTHPCFDFYPQSTTTLKIIIDVKSVPVDPNAPVTSGYTPPPQREKGCITVLILDRPADEQGFSNN